MAAPVWLLIVAVTSVPPPPVPDQASPCPVYVTNGPDRVTVSAAPLQHPEYAHSESAPSVLAVRDIGVNSGGRVTAQELPAQLISASLFWQVHPPTGLGIDAQADKDIAATMMAGKYVRMMRSCF